tara:strand:- start:10679 stop:11473 length:795 start_codon:yes stop_codon:yes gene_type:complete
MKDTKVIKLFNKKIKTPMTCLTAYSSTVAKLLDGKVDFVLIGDSLSSTVYGMKNTQNVTLEMMKRHSIAVTKEIKKSLTIIDMPYNTYTNKEQAYKNAKFLLKKTKANFLKLEITKNRIPIVKYLTEKNINIVGHIGVTPQSYREFSKIKVIGKNLKEIKDLVQLADRLEIVGAKLILLECVTEQATKKIMEKISIPTIGIGASKHCDGQVLVLDDILNLSLNKNKPKFVKKYFNLKNIYNIAINNFVKDVKNKKFPSKKNSYF